MAALKVTDLYFLAKINYGGYAVKRITAIRDMESIGGTRAMIDRYLFGCPELTKEQEDLLLPESDFLAGNKNG